MHMEPGELQSMESQRVGHDLETEHARMDYILWYMLKSCDIQRRDSHCWTIINDFKIQTIHSSSI